MATGVLKTSILQYGSNSHVTTSEEANYFASDFITQGITGTIANTNGFAPSTGGFAVNQEASPTMQVQIVGSGATTGAYISCVPQGQDAQMLRVNQIGNTDLTIASNATGSTRYDWIYLKVDPTLANNPDVNATTVTTVVVSRSTSNSTDNGGLTPAYGMLLAVVTVANGAASIVSGNIQDRRVLAAINAPLNLASSTLAAWNPLLPLVFTYSSNNGNKEFTVTNGTNLTTLIPIGAKFQVARTVTPPTSSMAFAGASSQYATKATPAGLTFSAAFTLEAWAYLQIPTGAIQHIVNRFDRALTSGGWSLDLNSNNQLEVVYGSGANFTAWLTSQSIPFLRWVHLAAVVSSVSAKTLQGLYVNGLSVPVVQTNAAGTSLTQTTDLRVGAAAATPAGSYFNGFLSEVRVWAVAQSAASIQNNMGINCIGTEPNLVCCIPGNGNFNDLTTNANSLTAVNGAIATNVANPFNAIEYGVVTKNVFSAGITTLTISTGDTCTIPNQTLTNPYYSTAQTPFGLPGDLCTTYGRRLAYIPIGSTQSGGTTLTQLNAINQYPITIPQNCTKVKVTYDFPSTSNTNAGTNTLGFYNGAASNASTLGVSAQGNGPGFMGSFEVSVVPGSQLLLNGALFTSVGTVNLIGPQVGSFAEQGVWVEQA